MSAGREVALATRGGCPSCGRSIKCAAKGWWFCSTCPWRGRMSLEFQRISGGDIRG